MKQANPEDILLVETIDRKIRELDTPSSTQEVNPEISQWGRLRFQANRSFLVTLFVEGIYGIINGIYNSKFLRIVIPLLILFFIAGIYFVIDYWKQLA